MKNTFYKISMVIILLFAFSANIYSQEMDEVIGELKESLELSEEQETQFAEVLKKYAVRLNETMDKYENAEDADPKDKLTDLKAVRDDYREDLQKILSKNQYEKYQELINNVLQEMFTDIAEIKLMDLQKPLDLTDSQMEQLAPVLGKSIMDIMKIVVENGDKRMSMPRKVKVGKAMKKIQSATGDEVGKILTPTQIEKWEKIKEEKKKK
jgi:hypothetical protein